MAQKDKYKKRGGTGGPSGVDSWHNFAIGGFGRMGGQDSDSGFNWLKIGENHYVRGNQDVNRFHDNNSRRGYDRYGSKQLTDNTLDKNVKYGFKGSQEYSGYGRAGLSTEMGAQSCGGGSSSGVGGDGVGGGGSGMSSSGTGISGIGSAGVSGSGTGGAGVGGPGMSWAAANVGSGMGGAGGSSVGVGGSSVGVGGGGAGVGGGGVGGSATGGSGVGAWLSRIAGKLGINRFSVPAYIIKLILAIALSFSVVYALVKTSGLLIEPFTILLTCAAMMLFFSILFHNAYIANGSILAAIVALGIYVYHLYKTEIFDDYRIIASYYVRRFTYWTASFFFTGQPHISRFESVLFYIVCAAVCLLVYFITVKKYLFACMFAVGFSTFCTQWCYGFYAGPLAFFIFIGTMIVGYLWHIYLKNIGKNGVSSALLRPAGFLKSLTPLALCMIIAIAMVPKPDGPIRWQWVYDIYNRITDSFNDRFYYYRVDSFALNTTGFSNGESFLSGPIRVNNTQVLSVVTDDPAIYLKGNGKDTYTGNSWKNSAQGRWSASEPPQGPLGASDISDDRNAQNEQTTQNGQNGQNTQNEQNAQTGQNTQNEQNAQTGQNTQNEQNAQNSVNAPDYMAPWGIRLHDVSENAILFPIGSPDENQVYRRRVISARLETSPDMSGDNVSADVSDGTGTGTGAGTGTGTGAGTATDTAAGTATNTSANTVAGIGSNTSANTGAGTGTGTGAGTATDTAANAVVEVTSDTGSVIYYTVQQAEGGDSQATATAYYITFSVSDSPTGNAASPAANSHSAAPPAVNSHSAAPPAGNAASPAISAAPPTEDAVSAVSSYVSSDAPSTGNAASPAANSHSAAPPTEPAASPAISAVPSYVSSAAPPTGYYDVIDLESPDLTDVRDMEQALSRMDSGLPSHAPGPLYRDGATEVDQDTSEYYKNYELFIYRLLAGDAGQRLTTFGASPSSLRAFGRWLPDRNSSRANVRYDRMKTFSLFTVSKLANLNNLNMDTGDIYEEGGALSMEYIMSEGFSYDLEYYQEDGDSAVTQLMLNNSYPGLYRDMLDDYDYTLPMDYNYSSGFSNNYRDRDLRPYTNYMLGMSGFIDKQSLSDFADRADEIRARYTALPDELPERVRILAGQLTEGAETEYDKAQSLERFLYSNYDYSLNVGYLPSGEDFVDNFLFNMTEGYCTHFATALAVMARCAGLPSRYVEGYTMPHAPDENGVYKVTNAEAHAWVEIYFEGYGWRRFEPTATYQNRFNQQTDEDEAPNAGGYSTGGDFYDYMEDMRRGQGSSGYTGASDTPVPSPGAQRAALIATVVRVILIIVVCLIPICVIMAGRRRVRLRATSFSAEPGQAVRSMYKHYLKILRRLEYGIGRGETLAHFSARVDAAMRFRDAGLVSALGVFEKMIYSDHAITEADRQKVRAVYPKLLDAYSLRKSRLTFFFMKEVIAEI